MEHKLKILSKYYESILQGKKTFEVRKYDRPFSEGDTLLLQECVTPNDCGYTGREMTVDVTYILRDSEYVKDGYCIMGIKILSTEKTSYGQKITDTNTIINKRIDDAFTELNNQRNLTSSLIRDYRQLKAELVSLQDKQKSNLLWTRMLTGVSAVMWVILLILKLL